MTSIVGVLNKHGVAIAADSAVTYGSTHKVVNSANKIFTLSKYRPIAIMTHGNASFMGVPWEIIIKEYRRHLGSNSFSYVEGYVEDFVSFLHERKLFCDEASCHIALKELLESFYDICYRTIIGRHRNELVDTSQINDYTEQTLQNLYEKYKNRESCPEFVDYDYDTFSEQSKKDIDIVIRKKNISCDDLFAKTFYHILTSKIDTLMPTGLVFVGYGEEEIYPTLIPLKVSIVIDNRIVYYKENDKVSKIGKNNQIVAVTPFAQVDVIQTIMNGIHPTYSQIIYKSINKAMLQVISQILQMTNIQLNITPLFTKNHIDLVMKDCITEMRKEMGEIYTDHLIRTIATLDIPEMANIAEKLISLTSLVRSMQPGQATVGGPVDVAVITKGDGFIWINRKHYFRPELNQHFFGNYFNEE